MICLKLVLHAHSFADINTQLNETGGDSAIHDHLCVSVFAKKSVEACLNKETM